MGYQSHKGSRRGSGQKFQKSQHEKAKNKAHKRQDKGKFLEEETTVTASEIAEKTLNSLKRLGEQKFAVSPFSQYFDDWLLNVKQTLSELETSQAITVDELFVKEREQMLAVVERDLAELKQEEAALNIGVKELAENNHILVETDAEYAAKTRETSGKRNAEIQRLTLNVHDLEAEVKRVRAMKTSFFGGFSKKAKAQREADILNKLASAETELERALQLFKAEQEKFHDEYEKKKQATTEKVQRLEKEVERLENDESIKVRHDASETLCEAISALLERQPAKPKEPA
jgi:hypothetical protein